VMPKAKAGVLDGSQYLDIGALLGAEHVVRTTEVVGKRPVGRPKGSTKRMRSAAASSSAAAAAHDIQEEGNQASDEGDEDTVDKDTVDKDTVEAALREKSAAVARVGQWFESEPGDEELICIACSHIHQILTIESVALCHPGCFIVILAHYSFLLAN
jgi:predicted aconitase